MIARDETFRIEDSAPRLAAEAKAARNEEAIEDCPVIYADRVYLGLAGPRLRAARRQDLSGHALQKRKLVLRWRSTLPKRREVFIASMNIKPRS